MHKSGLSYVTNRAFKMTLEDLQYYNNAMRILRDSTGRGNKDKISMRDLVMKLIRVYVNQNMDILRRLWAEDQTKTHKNGKLPKITLF